MILRGILKEPWTSPTCVFSRTSCRFLLLSCTPVSTLRDAQVTTPNRSWINGVSSKVGGRRLTCLASALMTSRSQWRWKSHLLRTSVSTNDTATTLAARLDSNNSPLCTWAHAQLILQDIQTNQSFARSNCYNKRRGRWCRTWAERKRTYYILCSIRQVCLLRQKTAKWEKRKKMVHFGGEHEQRGRETTIAYVAHIECEQLNG